MSQTEIIFQGKDAALIESYRRQMREQDKVIAKYEQMAQGGKRAGQAAEDVGNQAAQSMARFAGELVGVTSAIGAAMMVVEAIKAEYEQLRNIQRAAGGAQVASGTRKTGILANFSEDPTLKASDLTATLNQLSRETSATREVTDETFKMALASRGSLSNADVIEASRLGLQYNPTDAEAAGQSASRILQVREAFGGTTRQAQGYIEAGNALVPVADPALYGANIVGQQIGMGLAGWAPEHIAELTGVLSMGDQRGAKTGTAIVNTQQNLMGFRPTSAGKDADGQFTVPQAQIDAWNAAQATNDPFAMKDVIRDNPELQRMAMSSMQFPIETGNIQRAFLRGELDDRVEAMRERMPAYGPGLGDFVDQMFAARENDPEVQRMLENQARVVATEQTALTRDKAAIEDQVLKIAEDIEANTNRPGIDWFTQVDRTAIQQWASVEGNSSDFAGAAAERYRYDLKIGRFSGDDRRFVESLLPLLDRLAVGVENLQKPPLPAQQRNRPQ